MPAMVPTDRWNDAAVIVTAPDGTRRAAIPQLPPGLPDAALLFAFMRDAELRFESLRLRLIERRWVASGEIAKIHELLLRHPGRARGAVGVPGAGATANPEIWVSDGETVRTFMAEHRLSTSRPRRARLAGLDTDRDLPSGSRAYLPVTHLPANSLVDTFVHPAGFSQNVLATGVCRVLREEPAAGRTAVVLECLHPRTIDLAGDRPDHRLVVAVDRETGVVAGLAEFYGDRPTRLVAATELAPDATIPDEAFALHLPDGAASIY
jgi:hypothetical protein